MGFMGISKVGKVSTSFVYVLHLGGGAAKELTGKFISLMNF
jgi:hypothetical protein